MSPGTRALADAAPVQPEHASAHWAAVSRHLELGGSFFTYMDIDGDVNRLTTLVDSVMGVARDAQPSIPRDLKFGSMVDALGLPSLKAVGMSSRKLNKDFYHNRALLYMPEGGKGVFRLFGGKAGPAVISALAPADTDAAFQIEISLSALKPMLTSVLKATGEEKILDQFETGLNFPVPGLQMNIGQVMDKLDTRVMVIARLEDGQTIEIPGAPVPVPAFQLMLAVDGIDFLMEPLLTFAGAYDAVTIEKGDGFTTVQPNQALPGGMEKHFQPALYYDHKSKRVFLTTNLEYARTALTGATHLKDDPAFTKAMTGLPTEVNGLSYASNQFLNTVSSFSKEAVKAAPGKNLEAMRALLKALEDGEPGGDSGVGATFSNVPEGMLFQSNASDSHKTTLVLGAAVPLACIAGALGSYQQTMERLKTATPQVRKKPLPADDEAEEEPAENTARTIRSNLQQIAFSSQAWFLDNPSELEVTYDKLVEAELIFDLDAAAGESYKGLTLQRAGGTLNVKTKGGESFSQNYPAVTD